MNNIQNAYEQIRKANLIAGQLTGPNHEQTLNGIISQIEICQEELDETRDAFYNQDVIELLDGACDLFVTAAGLMQRLEAAGFNVEKAITRVVDNNLTKFPKNQVARQDPSLQPEDTEAVESPYGYTAYLRADGKYRKPTNYVPVNLSGCENPELFMDVEAEEE